MQIILHDFPIPHQSKWLHHYIPARDNSESDSQLADLWAMHLGAHFVWKERWPAVQMYSLSLWAMANGLDG